MWQVMQQLVGALSQAVLYPGGALLRRAMEAGLAKALVEGLGVLHDQDSR